MGLILTTAPELSGYSGLVHGFEQRQGSGAPETREESRDRVRAALRHDGQLHLLKQVHGATVRRAPWVGTPEGDAALAAEAGLLLGIETADCLPVLIVDPQRKAVAAAHAGWRGTAAAVVPGTIAALTAASSRLADLLAILGPCIGPCCYEVGDELRHAFGPAAEPFFRPGTRGRPHLDVRAMNAQQLQDAGVSAKRIHSVDHCTACRPDLYFSYRRDGPGTGRMINFVGWSSPPSPEAESQRLLELRGSLVHRAIGQSVGFPILFPWHVADGDPLEPCHEPRRLTKERLEPRVLHTVPSLQLPHQ